MLSTVTAPVSSSPSTAGATRVGVVRNRQVVRILGVLSALDVRHGWTVAQLAQRFGTSTRTIWRDLAALQEAGCALVDDRCDEHGQAACFRLMRGGARG